MRTAIERWMQNSNDYLFRIALPSGELLGCNEAADWLKEQFKTKGKQTLTDENLQIVFNELAAALQGASDAEINKENRISFHALRLSNSNEALVTLNVSEVVYPGKKALEAFENNVAGIYESRLDGKIIAANDAFGEILGFPTEELLTLNGNALYVHPDERVQFINAITTQGKVKNYEIRYQRKDETIAWCVESAFLYEKEDEKRIIGTVVDITEQKRNKDRFRNLFVSSADAVFLLEQGLVQDVNDRAADLFGGDLSRFKGLDALSQQNGLFVLSANDQVLVHKKMVSLKSGDIDRKRLIGRRADGSQFHAEVTFSRCEEAGAAIVQLVVRDISERIFYEEAIRESESRFKALSEVTLEGVVFAQDRIIRDCNPQMAELFGFNSPDDIIGRSIMDFVNEADLIRLEQTVDLRALNKTEIITRAKSGQLLVMDVSCSYIEYRNQRMKVFMFYDVTSRKRAEKALEQSTERYKSLVEHSPNGIFILTEGLIKYVNYSGVQLMGAEDEDEIYETEFLSFFNREDQLKLTSDLLRTREGEEVSYKEYRIISRDGSEVFVGFKPTLTVYEGLPSIQVNMNNLSVRMQLMQETMRAEIAEEINMVLKREIEEHKRTQEKLRAAENFTRNIIQSSIDMIIAVDDCNRITEFNHAAQVQFGYTSGEVMGKELSMLYKNPDDAARVIKEIKENQSFSGEIENITHSGRVFTSLLSASIIRNESGQVFGSMGVSRDITELKKAEKELRASEERYRDLFENATDFIFSIGEEGNFKYANKAFCQKLGVNQQQISNLNIAQILPEVKGLNLFEWFGEQERELTFLSLEGEEIQVFGSTTIRSKANKADSIRAIFRDITTLRKTEKTAKQQGAKLESIFNSSENLMIFTLNRKGVLTSSNKHVHNWLKNNLSRKYKTGESFFDLLQDIIDHNLYHFNPSVFTEVFKGETNQLEIPVKTAQGETEWVEFFMNPVRVQDEIEEISCLVFDITDRKSMDRKILASLKEKEVLLQEVHHRVKNNLQVISSILNLQSSFVDDERILGILEESQSRIKTMSFIHETLYQTADFSSIDFAEYLNTLAKNLVQSYSKGDCAIELVTELKQINLNLDQAIPCGLIVNELVSNALKHAFKGRSNGNITLGISEVNHRVELKIADDGIGLPADFNPKESDSLGIYLVYALIEQLDAAIDVKSLNGTTFLITFDKQ